MNWPQPQLKKKKHVVQFLLCHHIHIHYLIAQWNKLCMYCFAADIRRLYVYNWLYGISSVRNLEVLPTNKKPGREETNEQAEVWKNPVMKLYAFPIEFRGVGPLAHCWHPHPSNTGQHGQHPSWPTSALCFPALLDWAWPILRPRQSWNARASPPRCHSCPARGMRELGCLDRRR